MKAIIICDDLAFAADAAATLALVGRQSGINVHWTTRCWSINAFNKLTLAENALVEALNAHLIVFPAPIARSLPSCVFSWLYRWAALRRIRDAALGVIKFATTPDLNNSRLLELSAFAQRHRLTLIVDQSPLVTSQAGFPVHFPAKHPTDFPSGLHFTHLASQGSCRGFGINE